MSANKSFETKVPESELESGYLSGPISESLSGLLSEGNVEMESDSKKVFSVNPDQEQETTDSGVDLQVSGPLSNLSFKDFTPTAEPTLLVDLSEDKSSVLPQLDRLFMQDDDGDTQLHIASIHGCQKSVSTLIKVCPQKAWMDVGNDYGHTALHLAVLSGHSMVTRMLVLAGASLDLRDVSGRTPLHLAVENNDQSCIEALILPSSNNTREKMVRVLNMRDFSGQTAIHYAARAGNFAVIRLLASYGADILAREGLAGWTALHIAAKASNVSLVRSILDKFAAVARVRDYSGRTARRYAVRNTASVAFKGYADSDSESDSEDDYDSDAEERESYFERLVQLNNPINVA